MSEHLRKPTDHFFVEKMCSCFDSAQLDSLLHIHMHVLCFDDLLPISGFTEWRNMTAITAKPIWSHLILNGLIVWKLCVEGGEREVDIVET